MTHEDFVLQVQHFCATRDVKMLIGSGMLHTTGHPRANLFFPGSVLPITRYGIPVKDQHFPPRTPIRCASSEYRILIEDMNTGRILDECSIHDPNATASQIAEWLVRIHRKSCADFYDGEPAKLEPTSMQELIQYLAANKQGWSTDGTGWLNGEDGTAIFLPGLIGSAVCAPSTAAVPIKHFTVKYGATTVYNMSGDCIVQAVDEKTARWEVENHRAFDDLAWDLVPHHELVSQLDKGSFNVMEVNEFHNSRS